MTNDKSSGAAKDFHLLRTKLFIPKAHPDIIERPSLTARLDAGLKCKLILVSAPAGFGKTTLLSSWLEEISLQRAWLSLDSRDNDPARFWAYLIAALQGIQPALGQNTQALFQAPQPPPIENIITELINEISGISEDFLLVLDDVHTIERESIFSGLEFLVDHMPPQMHLVLSGRKDPLLPLALLRARRELVELRAEDLRFSPQEAAAFLNQVMGLDLSSDDLASLEQLTEGWIAGLQLAALSMQSVDDIPAFVRSFGGEHRYVFDYLAHEVLNHLQSSERSFLLQTSILDRMSAAVCNAVTGRQDSQQILQELEQANLFLVPLDLQRHWFRYHHLFGDFLKAQLEQEQEPEQIHHLHQRASRWFEAQGFLFEAVEHALQGQDFDLAAQFIDRVALQAFRHSELITLLAWLQDLPVSYFNQHARLNMVAAWANLATGHSEVVDGYLQNVERLISAEADGSEQSKALPAQVRGVLGEISCIRSSLAFNRFDLKTVRLLASRAREYLHGQSEGGLFNNREDLLSVVFFNLGLAYEFDGEVLEASEAFRQTIRLSEENIHLLPMATSHLAQLQVIRGQLRQAEKTYRQALRKSEELGRISPLAGMAHTGLGSLLVEWNQLESAARLLERGVELGRRWSQWEILMTGYFGLVRIAMAQSRVESAFELLQTLEELAGKLEMPMVARPIQAVRALWQARSGDLEAARRWVQACGIDAQAEIPYLQEADALILARVWIALQNDVEAMTLIDRLLESTQTGERWGRVIELRIYQALVWKARDELDAALGALETAFQLAEPEGYVRLFLDEGQPMLALLKQAAQRDIAPGYVSRLLENFAQNGAPAESIQAPAHTPPAGSAHQTASSQDLLSDRELEVLRLVARGMTNQEIADELVISLNTVKSHVKNIYARLQVRNRAEAISIAKELEIL
ncbi:MAG: LuxR C-terminal-related transcriptional regulator [Anaerolineales bacterium]